MAKRAESKKFFNRLEIETESNQSKVSMVLGALIVLVIGVLVFNYFNKPKSDLGPAQQTQTADQDVSKENLPGKYTVKEGDTLFLIAEKYYNDGYRYTEIASANNLADANQIELGQTIDIPKLETQAQASPEASASPVAIVQDQGTGTGGGDTTIWGTKIEGNSYTVVEGDWLSTIAGRAYGDIFAYDKIAKANNIPNPDLIEPGTTLTIPR